MPTVSMPPVEEARTIFRRLGYDVDGDGPDLEATRKWRTVRVTALCEDDAETGQCPVPDGGRDDVQYRCFVTWTEATDALRTRLRRVDPGYEWAIIGVESDDEYEVVHGDAESAA